MCLCLGHFAATLACYAEMVDGGTMLMSTALTLPRRRNVDYLLYNAGHRVITVAQSHDHRASPLSCQKVVRPRPVRDFLVLQQPPYTSQSNVVGQNLQHLRALGGWQRASRPPRP